MLARDEVGGGAGAGGAILVADEIKRSKTQSVKCYRGGPKIQLISSISGILS